MQKLNTCLALFVIPLVIGSVQASAQEVPNRLPSNKILQEQLHNLSYSYTTRITALRALLESDRTLQTAYKALQHPDFGVRKEGIYWLGLHMELTAESQEKVLKSVMTYSTEAFVEAERASSGEGGFGIPAKIVDTFYKAAIVYLSASGNHSKEYRDFLLMMVDSRSIRDEALDHLTSFPKEQHQQIIEGLEKIVADSWIAGRHDGDWKEGKSQVPGEVKAPELIMKGEAVVRFLSSGSLGPWTIDRLMEQGVVPPKTRSLPTWGERMYLVLENGEFALYGSQGRMNIEPANDNVVDEKYPRIVTESELRKRSGFGRNWIVLVMRKARVFMFGSKLCRDLFL